MIHINVTFNVLTYRDVAVRATFSRNTLIKLHKVDKRCPSGCVKKLPDVLKDPCCVVTPNMVVPTVDCLVIHTLMFSDPARRTNIEVTIGIDA